MDIITITKKEKEAKMAKLSKLDKVKQQMEDLNYNPINPGLEKMVQYLKENGPSTVQQLANHFEVTDSKAIRRPFQKAGLKKGNYAVEVGDSIVVLDQRSKKNIYSIK